MCTDCQFDLQYMIIISVFAITVLFQFYGSSTESSLINPSNAPGATTTFIFFFSFRRETRGQSQVPEWPLWHLTLTPSGKS